MERIWLKSYPEGVPADINPTAYASLADFFAASVERYRDRVAYVSLKRTMTYRELDGLSRAFASYLKQVVGLEPGARVALMMPNLLQYPVALFGALRAGYVVVNCNPLYSPRELHHQLEDSGAEAIVVLENFAQTLEKAIDGTQVRVVIVTGVGDLLGAARGFVTNLVVRHVKRAVPPWRLPHAVRFNRALAQGRVRKAELPKIEPDDLAFLQYTGGTTGVPKGAMLTHRNMIANLQQVAAWIAPAIAAERRDVRDGAAALSRLRADGERLRPDDDRREQSPDPRSARHQGLRQGAGETPFTVITGVNTLFNALLNDPGFLRLDFSHLHVAVGGRHGRAARGRRALEAGHRQAADRRLRPDRDLRRSRPRIR